MYHDYYKLFRKYEKRAAKKEIEKETEKALANENLQLETENDSSIINHSCMTLTDKMKSFFNAFAIATIANIAFHLIRTPFLFAHK
jgi:hypothetical protein